MTHMSLNTNNANHVRMDMAKSSEANLPADERRQTFVPGDDPLEVRPVRRFSETSKPSCPIKGGQGRSGAEIEAGASILLWPIAIAAGCLLGWAAASGVVALADAVGAWCAS